MHEQVLEIETPSGRMETFVTHPEEDGPFPPVIIYMDIWGVREELFEIARRVGTVGYYCLVPDFYYRQGRVRHEFRDAQNRMILTAARPDRTSFGCGEANTYTFFDQCFLESVPQSRDFPMLAVKVQACVAQREAAGDNTTRASGSAARPGHRAYGPRDANHHGPLPRCTLSLHDRVAGTGDLPVVRPA